MDDTRESALRQAVISHGQHGAASVIAAAETYYKFLTGQPTGERTKPTLVESPPKTRRMPVRRKYRARQK